MQGQHTVYSLQTQPTLPVSADEVSQEHDHVGHLRTVSPAGRAAQWSWGVDTEHKAPGGLKYLLLLCLQENLAGLPGLY